MSVSSVQLSFPATSNVQEIRSLSIMVVLQEYSTRGVGDCRQSSIQPNSYNMLYLISREYLN